MRQGVCVCGRAGHKSWGVKLVFPGMLEAKNEIELGTVGSAEKVALTCLLGIFKVFRGDF